MRIPERFQSGNRRHAAGANARNPAIDGPRRGEPYRFLAVALTLLMVFSSLAGTVGFGASELVSPSAPALDGTSDPATGAAADPTTDGASGSSLDALTDGVQYDRSTKLARNDYVSQAPPGFEGIQTADWASMEGTAPSGVGHEHARPTSFQQFATTDACPVNAPRKNFDVVAISVDIPLNRFGDHDPQGRMFVLADMVDDVRAQERIPASNPDRVQTGLKDDAIQPLVVRANLGDCVVVTLENRLHQPNAKGISHAEPVSFSLTRGPISTTSDGIVAGTGSPELVAPGDSRTYTFYVPDDQRYEGPWYFHSSGDFREQVNHGLFGSLNVEHKGSTYLHPETLEPLASGWEAVVVDGQEGYAYREYTVVYHEVGDDDYMPQDRNDDELPLIDPHSETYRPCAFATNYRSECFMHRLELNEGLSDDPDSRAGPDHDKSLLYHSYPFGDPATPMPRAYTADPSKVLVVHGGGEQFHSHHLHGGGIRWLFEPHADSHPAEFAGHDVMTASDDETDDGLRKTNLEPRSESSRVDAQSIGPGETFVNEIACGAGGCQRGAGDFLYHCHVSDHYLAGMWSFWRVYNTKQADLAELPDRQGETRDAVDSTELLGTELPSGTVLTEENIEQWIESNLPTQGVPEGYDAAVHDWTKEETTDGVLYLSEPEDTRSWANFESETPGERRPILFDPATGRLAHPWLSPHLGARPPFAPGHGPAPYLATTPMENINELVPQNNDRPTMPVDPERPKDSICPAGSRILRYNIVSIQRPVQFNGDGDGIDDAMVYVLAEDLDENGNPTKAIEPLIYRANVGDCIQLTYVNGLPDGTEFNSGFSKSNIHPHFIQFDPQASDGAVVGLNYEQSIRNYESENRVLSAAASAGDTTLSVTRTAGLHEGGWVGVGLATDDIELHKIETIDEAAGTVTLTEPLVRDHPAGRHVGVEFTRYAYYVDVDLGNVYFHDHVDAYVGWPRGLFGTLVVEPRDSEWRDPETGEPLRSGAVADIITDKPTVFGAAPGSYREMALIFSDSHEKNPVDGNVMGTVNLRAEPFADRMGAGEAYALSSVANGDPSTPMVRAYEGDPLYVHVLNAGTWNRYPIRLTGHEFEFEHIVDDSGRSITTPTDALQVDFSERFDLWVKDSIRERDGVGEAGDYLWYVPQADHFEQGMWGIVRVHDTRQPDLVPLPDRAAPPSGDGFPTLSRTGGAPPSAPVRDVCPTDAPVSHFDVVATRVDVDSGSIEKAFVLREDAAAAERGEGVEPLVLRAAAGECVEVTVENRLGDPVSLHIGRGKVDPQTSLGITVGYNNDQSVPRDGTRTYRVFAHRPMTGVIADFAQLEDMEGQASGLYGAFVVAPAGAQHFDPRTGERIQAGTEAVVVAPDRTYRDNVLLFHEEDDIFEGPVMPYNTHPQGESLVNYRTEPLTADRLDNPATAFDSDVHGDPATPILEAYAGDPTTVHVVQGYGFQNSVFGLSGHGWQRDANVPASSIIGVEKFAPHMVVDAELEGGAGSPGDYLWQNYRLGYMEAGQWGLFRVHASGQSGLLPLSAFSLQEDGGDGGDQPPEDPENPEDPEDPTQPPEDPENPPAEPPAGEKTLTIVGTGSTANYALTVSSDDLAKSTAFGASVDAFDQVSADGTTATGRVIGGSDSYTFTGDIVALDVAGSVDLLLNGEPVTLGELLPGSRVLTVVGTGPRVNYALTVTDSLAKSTAFDGSIQTNDVVVGTSASGQVVARRDSYAVVGDVVAFQADGPVDLLLDGEPVEPADLPLLAHTVTVVGDGTRAFYEFDASGDVVKTLADGGSIQANDVIDGRHVSGTVVGGVDSFAFDGDLTGLSVTGSARVFVDGVEVTPDGATTTGAGVPALLVPSVAGAAFVSLVRRRSRPE